ncbi:MAG: hypothetical protein IVW52_09315 [Acidimicrobiales bacterium]|nr:hypothetical protein [Acidimicrobiales bacterium]
MVNPPTVWLCAPAPDADDPPLPIWASRCIEAFSAPGAAVVVRALGSYPALPGEAAALIAAAATAGRRAHAVLPTPTLAARTRALLPAAGITAPGPHPNPGHGSSPGHPLSGRSGRERGHTPGTATPDPDHADRQDVAAATPGHHLAEHAGAEVVVAAAGSVPAMGEAAGRGGTVGVGRRRPATEAGPADLVVVLAGPVSAAARVAGKRPLSARVLTGWTRVLRPGGVLVVLTPSVLGRAHRWWGPASVIVAGQDAGLTYTQHCVLVHSPVIHGELARPTSSRRPHAPFWSVHTDLFVLTKDTALAPAHDPFGDPR